MADPLLVEIDAVLAADLLAFGHATEMPLCGGCEWCHEGIDECPTYLEPTPELSAWLSDWIDRKVNGLPITRTWWRW